MLFTGWRSLGSLGGEVSSGFDFLKALPLALLLGVLSYVLPLLVALSETIPSTEEHPWEGGYLAVAYDRILHGLGIAIAVAGFFGNIGLTANAMLVYPRVIWGAADKGWLPRFFTWRSKTLAPYMAVLLQFITASVLLLFDFSVLVRLETVIAAPSYILSVLCLAKLRYSEPDAPRPIMYPKSFIGSCFLVGVPSLTFVAVFVLNFQSWGIAAAAVGVWVVVGAAYFIQLHVKEKLARQHEPLNVSPSPPSSMATVARDYHTLQDDPPSSFEKLVN